MSVGEFIGTMLPLSTVSLVLVLILCITVKNKKFEVENTENNEIVVDKKGVAVYGVLFLLCIGCVLHILNYIYLFVIVSVVMMMVVVILVLVLRLVEGLLQRIELLQFMLVVIRMD